MEKTFYAESMSQDQFYDVINNWFTANQNIKVRKLYTSENTKFGLLVNKSVVSNVTLIYDIDEHLHNHYGIAYFEKSSLMKISMESMKQQWQSNNPNLDIVTYTYTHNARGRAGNLLLNGIGAMNRNQLWLIYKTKSAEKATPTPAPQGAVASAKKFCTYCGNPLTADSVFCQSCGKKV